MTDRTRARRIALQVLYQADVTGEAPGQVEEAYIDSRSSRPVVRSFVRALVRGCLARWADLDRLIAAHAANWSIERMASVDRNVLRLGAYEILFDPEVPQKVAIDEAVELAKRYGGPESGAFVNGILDAIRKDHAAGA